jgi:hypothetical protein
MMTKGKIVAGLFIWLFCLTVLLPAQQHKSVPLDNDVYHLIDNAALRGLCGIPSSARPWSELTVREILTEILNAAPGLLSDTERSIISGFLDGFERAQGLDWKRGAYYTVRPLKNGSYYSFEGGVFWDSTFAVNFKNPLSVGTTNVVDFYLDGDIGNHVSYDFNFRPGFYMVEREKHPSYVYDNGNGPITVPETYEITSYFPYTFLGIWDGVVFNPLTGENFKGWPDALSFGYEVISEIDASYMDNRLQFRFGRMRRDWGAEGNGASLFLNAHARPFLAIEGTYLLIDWLRLSSLTGVLEYWARTNEMKYDAYHYQNAFSAALLELNTKYFHVDLGASVIWPKRFELGYIYPANSNLVYQNNIGDFDNLALYGNIEGFILGKGKWWFSAYLDEAKPSLNSTFFTLDRNMYALQAGAKARLPWLPFASVTLRYTKIEPYCYTHPYTVAPWYNEAASMSDMGDITKGMATNYINTGESLGYYLHPNSDEFLVRFESLIKPGARGFLQYQMIRHGVEYGPGRVDGSGLEDQQVYDDNTKKYFLRDGVYQWSHIVKIGGAYNFKTEKIPVSVYGDFGIVAIQFSATDAPPGSEEDRPFHFISDGDAYYKPTVGVVASVGFRIFP